jgi:hypothetical protein
LHWLQVPSQIKDDNLKNVRGEASVHFRNKERGYLKELPKHRKKWDLLADSIGKRNTSLRYLM